MLKEINELKNKFLRLYSVYKDTFLVLSRKGVFPYEYMDSNCFDKLKEKQLPELRYWFSKLNHDDPNDEKIIKKVKKEKECADFIFKYFKCKNMKKYNDLYVTTDLFLLSDIFVDYRKRSYNLKGVDQIYSVSLPGFSNRAMLKYTESEIE